MPLKKTFFKNKPDILNDDTQQDNPHFNIVPNFKQSLIIFFGFFAAALLVLALSHMV